MWKFSATLINRQPDTSFLCPFQLPRICFRGHPSPDTLRFSAKVTISATHHIRAITIHIRYETMSGHSSSLSRAAQSIENSTKMGEKQGRQ